MKHNTRLTVLVSPHCDDVAFSIGGILAEGFLPKPIIGVTVFTRSASAEYYVSGLTRWLMSWSSSDFLRRCGVPVRQMLLARSNLPMKILLEVETTKVRKQEDIEYFRILRIRHFDLDLLDAPLRGYRRISSKPLDTDEAVKLVQHAMKVIATAGSVCIITPLGIGGHVDHIVVRDACRSFEKVADIAFYEDLPYASRFSREKIEHMVHQFDPSLVPVDLDVRKSLMKKLSNLCIYRSQVRRRDKTFERIAEYTAHSGSDGLPSERIWVRQSSPLLEKLPNFRP